VGTAGASFTSADAQALLTADDKMCWASANAQGGSYEAQIYNGASGGVPIAAYVAFDWTAPGTWIKHSGTAWGGVSGSMASPAEAALLVKWAGGFSTSGKPVSFRKWYHAVPVSSVGDTGQDVTSSSLTSLQTAAQSIVGVFGSKGLTLGSPSGRLAGTASVDPYYNNHQMSRGRKRKVVASAAKAQADYSAILGIINGANFGG
jgi:hypothetical protein